MELGTSWEASSCLATQEIRMFITLFTKARNLFITCAKEIQSTPAQFHSFKNNFSTSLLSKSRPSSLSASFRLSYKKSAYTTFTFLCLLHPIPISSFLKPTLYKVINELHLWYDMLVKFLLNLVRGNVRNVCPPLWFQPYLTVSAAWCWLRSWVFILCEYGQCWRHFRGICCLNP